MTTRYNTSKIYKLVNDVDDKIYVGSSCLPLSKRLYSHKQQAKHKPAPVHHHLNSIGWEHVRIILIESVNVNTKEQLVMREQHYIDLLKPSLNKRPAYVNCPHGRQHNYCKLCNGSSMCIHNRQKSQCKQCDGSSICEHNRIKSQCKQCGGSSICIHNRQKSQCKDCGGSSMCIHNKQKSQCKICNGDKYHCYACEKTFAGKASLTRHNKNKTHIYNFIHY